jgi:hypothetical protein
LVWARRQNHPHNKSRRYRAADPPVIGERDELRALARDLQDTTGLRDYPASPAAAVTLFRAPLLARAATESECHPRHRDYRSTTDGHRLAVHVLDACAGSDPIAQGLKQFMDVHASNGAWFGSVCVFGVTDIERG